MPSAQRHLRYPPLLPASGWFRTTSRTYRVAVVPRCAGEPLRALSRSSSLAASLPPSSPRTFCMNCRGERWAPVRYSPLRPSPPTSLLFHLSAATRCVLSRLLFIRYRSASMLYLCLSLRALDLGCLLIADLLPDAFCQRLFYRANVPVGRRCTALLGHLARRLVAKRLFTDDSTRLNTYGSRSRTA